jgi:uncharacterized protein YjbI with pentapeptide repeats
MSWLALVAAAVAVLVVAFIVAAYVLRWEWAGFAEAGPDRPAKTLWDWLQLLIVPAILIAVVALWNASQTTRDKNRENQERQDATLTAYLSQMSDLMLNGNLLNAEVGSEVKAVARSVTLAMLPRLDGERRAAVIRFLYEGHLLQIPHEHDVYLNGANLQGAMLEGAQLPSAFLGDAILENADLGLVNLGGANLRRANLAGANLTDAVLGGANLSGADLTGANLTRANLGGAILSGANLAGAKLRLAHLGGANLGEANLRDATGLDLARYLTNLPRAKQKAFLDSQKTFFDLLSPDGLAKFDLSPEKLAKFRREANGA